MKGRGQGPFSDRLIRELFAPLEMFTKIALAVSGGPDSVAMMALIRRWCGLLNRDLAGITVLTVDHGLRPNSRDDAEFVLRLAARHGLGAAMLAWEGDKPKTGVQAAARAARYELLMRYCREHGIGALATAHTRDDQAETFLMRLRRGSGLDGLAGMSPQTDLRGIALLRPLLAVSKARLLAYLRAEHIPFVRDPSNENLAFERIRLRFAMKALANAGIRAEALVRSTARLQRSRAALDEFADEFLDRHFEIFPLGNAEIDLDALIRAPAELALRALTKALGLVGGEATAPRFRRLERLLDHISARGRKVTIGGCVIEAGVDSLHLFREPGRMRKDRVLLSPGDATIWDKRFFLSLSAEAAGPVGIGPLGEGGWLALKEKAISGRARVSRLAALSTPGAWVNGKLLAAPVLGWRDPESPLLKEWLQAALAPPLARRLKSS